VVGTAGFEPATPCSQSRCADQAAPRPVKTATDLRFLLLDGAEAVSIALQHHLTGVLSCRLSEPRLPDLAPLLRAASPGREQVRRTVETYLEAVRLLKAYLAGRGVDLAEADRAQIEAFLADLLARWKPATAANRYRSLKVFYAWLEEEGEISADPMAKMKPPAIPEQPIPIVPDEALRRLSWPVLARTSRPAGTRP
jgi:integrase